MVLVAAVVVLGAWLASESPLLDVDQIDVGGNARTSADEIRDAANVGSGVALLRLRTGSVEKRVEALPWIDQAMVRRHWPNRITITVTERQPALFIKTNEEFTVLDKTGRVLDVQTEFPGIPELKGIKPTEPGGVIPQKELAIAIAAFPQQIRGRLTVVQWKDNALTLNILDGPELRMGSLEDLADKAAAAASVLAQVDQSNTRYIDVAVPGSPVSG